MMLNLRPVDMDKVAWFTGAEAVAGSDDLCFLTDASLDEVAKHLRDCGVAIEVGPVARRGARGEMTSVYCRDPDGNSGRDCEVRQGALALTCGFYAGGKLWPEGGS